MRASAYVEEYRRATNEKHMAALAVERLTRDRPRWAPKAEGGMSVSVEPDGRLVVSLTGVAMRLVESDAAALRDFLCELYGAPAPKTADGT